MRAEGRTSSGGTGAALRPAPNAQLALGYYPATFRYLLGSRVNAARADAAVAASLEQAQRAAIRYSARRGGIS